MVDVPHTLSAGGTIVASQLNTNFDTLEDAAENLRSANLAADAGITSGQLADRYHLDEETILIVPLDSGANLGSPTEFSVPTSDTTIFRKRLNLKSGQEAYLVEAEFYVHGITAAVTAYPTLAIQIDGVTVGGSAVTINADATYWRLRNTNPIDNPLQTVNNAQVLSVVCGRSDASGTPTIGGVWLRLLWKKRVTN